MVARFFASFIWSERLVKRIFSFICSLACNEIIYYVLYNCLRRTVNFYASFCLIFYPSNEIIFVIKNFRKEKATIINEKQTISRLMANGMKTSPEGTINNLKDYRICEVTFFHSHLNINIFLLFNFRTRNGKSMKYRHFSYWRTLLLKNNSFYAKICPIRYFFSAAF